MKKNGIKITVLGPGGQSVSVFGRRLDVDSPPWAINDLENQPRDTGEALGAMKMVLCLDNLEGETVYLVDTGFAGSAAFMKEVRDWFTRNQPSVKTELRHKKTSMFNPM